MQTIRKSSKLDNVCYDIRGPVLARARQMEDEGQHIIKLNIGNLAPFGFEAPEEIVQDMIRNLPEFFRLLGFARYLFRAQGDHALHPGKENRRRWRR